MIILNMIKLLIKQFKKLRKKLLILNFLKILIDYFF